MKKILLLIAAVITTMAAHAQYDEYDRMVIYQDNGETKAFICDRVDSIKFMKSGNIAAMVNVDNVGSHEATLSATLPEGCRALKFAVIEESLTDTVSSVFNYVLSNEVAELKESGSVTINKLKAGTAYVVYALSMDIYDLPTTFVTAQVITKKSEADFTFNVTELTSGHLIMDITPDDKNISYTYTLLPKSKYDEAVSYNGDIMGYDVAWWQFMADNYGMADWREAMKKTLVTGSRTFVSQDEYGFMDWDTDHVFYCYGINEQGEVTTPLYTKEIRTPKPVPSDNKIKVEILQTRTDGCDVRVTTTNNDDYVITAQKQSYVDYWNTEGTETDMLKTLYGDLDINTDYCSFKHSGSGEFSVKAQKAGTEYVLIIFGTNEGPTTDVQYIKFKTAE